MGPPLQYGPPAPVARPRYFRWSSRQRVKLQRYVPIPFPINSSLANRFSAACITYIDELMPHEFNDPLFADDRCGEVSSQCGQLEKKQCGLRIVLSQQTAAWRLFDCSVQSSTCAGLPGILLVSRKALNLTSSTHAMSEYFVRHDKRRSSTESETLDVTV